MPSRLLAATSYVSIARPRSALSKPHRRSSAAGSWHGPAVRQDRRLRRPYGDMTDLCVRRIWRPEPVSRTMRPPACGCRAWVDQEIVFYFCSSRAACPAYLGEAMGQQPPVGRIHPARNPALEWPSGSAVFVCTPTGGRTEAGRVVLDGAQWRVWLRRGNGYRDRGTAPQRSAAVMVLLDAATRPVRCAGSTASMRLTSRPSPSQAGRPRKSGTRG